MNVRCPDCDELLEGNVGRVPAPTGSERIRLQLDCWACAANLEVLVGSTGSSVQVASATVR